MNRNCRRGANSAAASFNIIIDDKVIVETLGHNISLTWSLPNASSFWRSIFFSLLGVGSLTDLQVANKLFEAVQSHKF